MADCNKSNEQIVLCKMFSGNYWEDENNIGYESINMFLPDSEKGKDNPISYIYLPANGDYKVNEHKITHVLLIRSIPETAGKKVQIIGKAEVCKELLRGSNGASKITSCITAGKTFNGLKTIYDKFNADLEKPDKIVKNNVSQDIINYFANCYGKSPKGKDDYFELALEMGLCTKRTKVMNEESFKGKIVAGYKKAREFAKINEEQSYLKSIKYGGKTYEEIFTNNASWGALNIFATLKVKNLKIAKEEIYLTIDRGLHDDTKALSESFFINPTFIKIEKINGEKREEEATKNLSATSQTVYLENDIKEEIGNQDLLTALDSCKWNDKSFLSIDAADVKYLEDSFLTVIKKEYDELTYSNLFAHFFRKSPQFTKWFFKKIANNINIDKAKVSAAKIEISDEDWKDVGGKKVKREEKYIDIVINVGNSVIVIENKIKSALNGKNIEDNGEAYKDQLPRYFKYIKEKYPNKKHYFFVFAPNYNNIRKESFGKVKINGTEYEMAQEWKDIYYLTIFERFKEYKEENLLDNNKEFNGYDKFLFEEFIKAINVHTDSNMNNYYRQMQKRLCKIKKSLDK